MTSIFAPVSFSKSGARRCSGSAICGPVKVKTRTVTPLNLLFEEVFDVPFEQAAMTAAASARTRALVSCRLICSFPLSNLSGPGGRKCHEYGMFSLSRRVCQAPDRLFSPHSSDVSPSRGLQSEALEDAVKDAHEHRQGGQRHHQGGGRGRPVELALDGEEVAERDGNRLDLARRQH